MSRVRLGLLLGMALAGLGAAPAAGAAEAAPVYGLANGCYALSDAVSGRFVTRDPLGYGLGPTSVARATPFRLQATALGRYLLYGPDRLMPQATVPVTWRPSPALEADWSVGDTGDGLQIVSKLNGKALSVSSLGRRLTIGGATNARWSFVPTDGCAVFPELEVGATGEPVKGASPTAPVRGFLDSHTHVSAFRAFGGRFHCGRPWSPYGVTVALRDCSDHGSDGSTAILENLLTYGTLNARHSASGWPSFKGWPTHNSMTHESTYWKWLERAWRGGLRVMVNDLVENRALCESYWLKKNSCNEMVSARMQAREMHLLEEYIDAQAGGPGKGFLRIVTSPQQARAVINDGKLAFVLGIEVSEVLGCAQSGGVSRCTTAQIDEGLTELHDLGIQSAFVAHKFDNALAGTAFDDGVLGMIVNIGNRYLTGRWWNAQRCPAGQEADHTPPGITGNDLKLFQALGMGLGKQILNGSLPVYPPGPLCNPRGLTPLGQHMVRKMADLGMIVEADHMSVKARTQTLDLLEDLKYPGVISSHSWSDAAAQARLQRLGGLLSPYGNDADVYAGSWERVRSTRASGLFGIGYGSDSNGLGAQPGPRKGATNPVVYPYTTFDGGTTMDRQRAGTRTFDVNTDGVANYGLFPDYIEDLRQVAGGQIVEDLANGAEAYLQMWEKARNWTPRP